MLSTSISCLIEAMSHPPWPMKKTPAFSQPGSLSHSARLTPHRHRSASGTMCRCQERPDSNEGRLQVPTIDLPAMPFLTWTIEWSILLVIIPTERLGAMHVSVSEAKGQLTELVRRAEAGDEIVLTRHGQPAVRLVPVRSMPEPMARHQLLDSLRRKASAKATPGLSAARSQDELYGEDGLPE
jgi:prevent-host-death family protein